MTNKEAQNIIKVARAEVEWEYPLDYAVAFDKAIEALNGKIEIEGKVYDCSKAKIKTYSPSTGEYVVSGIWEAE